MVWKGKPASVTTGTRERPDLCAEIIIIIIIMEAGVLYLLYSRRSTPVAQLAPRNLLTRWDVSSIPANGIFLTVVVVVVVLH